MSLNDWNALAEGRGRRDRNRQKFVPPVQRPKQHCQSFDARLHFQREPFGLGTRQPLPPVLNPLGPAIRFNVAEYRGAGRLQPGGS
jgi:hypothetical protein